MTVGRANATRAVLAAAILGLALFGILAEYAPDSVAFSPNNYGWNGLEGVASSYHVNFTTSLSGLPARSVLVVMQPTMNFTSTEAGDIRGFLARGGTLLVADNSGYANSLLKELGTGMTIRTGYSINDPIYNWKAKTVPTALVVADAAEKFVGLANVTGIALNQPSPLILTKSIDSKIATTSPISYEVIAGPTSTKVATGQFTVAASVRIGNGTVLVVGDPQFILNSDLGKADNNVLIRNLFANTNVFIDASHWTTSPLTSSTAQLKAEFGGVYSVLSSSPLRYIMTIWFVVVSLALVPGTEKGRMTKANKQDFDPTRLNREVGERAMKERERLAETTE